MVFPFRRLLYFPRTDSGSGSPSMIIELFSILSSNLREGILFLTWDGSSTLPFLSTSTCNGNRPQVGGGSVFCIKDISLHCLCGATVFFSGQLVSFSFHASRGQKQREIASSKAVKKAQSELCNHSLLEP